jgi:hypothetical protein
VKEDNLQTMVYAYSSIKQGQSHSIYPWNVGGTHAAIALNLMLSMVLFSGYFVDVEMHYVCVLYRIKFV